MNQLTSDYGLIIKWSDYFIECYDYCPELLTFVSDTGSWLMPDYIFITEKAIKCYIKNIKPYCIKYKIIKTLKEKQKIKK